MKYSHFIFLIALGLSGSSETTMGVSVILAYHHWHFRAEYGDHTLHLRQKIQEECSLNVHDYFLHSVVLMAKTPNGLGEAWLATDGAETRAQTVAGSPLTFNSTGSYSINVFRNPNIRSQDDWRIKMRGDFRVKSVRLDLRRKQTDWRGIMVQDKNRSGKYIYIPADSQSITTADMDACRASLRLL